ncbi:hypothetical protein [Archangium sp.]|jgi:tetratricopeptide (TPR) repeat protein|uniref:tetratricopeptide repeat protein n=1 Tax=Archangium sp. TaxID=1872627 RepID=UPI002ED9B9B4
MTALSVSLGACSSWGNDGKQIEPPAPTPQAPIRPTVSTTKRTKPPPQPRLSITVNTTAELNSYRGWPLVIEAIITHPSAMELGAQPASVSPLKLAAPSSWSDLFHLEVKGESGAELAWPFVLLYRSPSSIDLDLKQAGELYWTISPADAAKLASGHYRVTAVLTAGNATPEGAWKGTARSNPVLMSLLDEPAPMPPVVKEAKLRVFSRFYLIRGEVDEAARIITEHLSENPESIAGLALSGELAIVRGNIPEAIRAYEQAIDAHDKRFPDSPEPPIELYSRLRQLREQLPSQYPPPPLEYLYKK